MSNPLGRPQILIVDDEPSNIHLLSEVLAPEYEVFFATSGIRALALAKERDLDLILLDILMPEMDGFEVCRRLKAVPSLRDIPIIFVTAMIDPKDEAFGLQIGAVDYVAKPVSPPVVLARVRTHLELKSQRDYLRSISSIDGLTGIPNRRRFDDALDAEWERARYSTSPLSLLLADMDYFRRFNDQYGYIKGDQCLRRVGLTLYRVAQKPEYLVARFGDDEFTCLLPRTGPGRAEAMARKLVEEVAGLRIAHGGSDLAPHLTVSVGATTVTPTKELAPWALLGKAYALLRRAKSEGRNRCLFEANERISAA